MKSYPMRSAGNRMTAIVLMVLCLHTVPGWVGWGLAVMALAGGWLASNVTESSDV